MCAPPVFMGYSIIIANLVAGKTVIFYESRKLLPLETESTINKEAIIL